MRLADGLGAEHALVVRPHPSVVDTVVGADGSAVVDGSWYADTTDLLLAADVLVTDDSSLLWDRVLTGGPMVFWMPGGAASDEPPGRRYLATGSLPGPVISEEDDLVAAILNAPDRRPEKSYRDLQVALAPLADGGAAARVVNTMLALGESS
jgi:CDP-glycerol glycerophosphotransferase